MSPDSPVRSPPWWIRPNLVGLDAVVVAVVWYFVFAKAAGAYPSWAEAAVLGCAVWAVYLGDRLLDSLVPPGDTALQPRHLVAARQRRWTVASVGGLVAVGAILGITGLRVVVLEAGLRLGLVVTGYFAVVWISRQERTAMIALFAVHFLLISALLHSFTDLPRADQVWRGAAVVGSTMVLFHYLGVRPVSRAAWTLPRKLLGGGLFAIGCVLAPTAHLQEWSLPWGAPVTLFGILCALNSLGIRLWEAERDGTLTDERILGRSFPWMAGGLAVAAAWSAWEASRQMQPLPASTGGAALLLLVLHLVRRKLPPQLPTVLADLAVLAGGVAALVFLHR